MTAFEAPARGSFIDDRSRPMAENPVGIVTISWRPPPRDLGGLLSDLHRVGYDGVQLGDTFPHGERLVSLLADHQLRLAEVYAALRVGPDGPTDEGLAYGRSRLQVLREAGGEVLVVALDGSEEREMWAGRSDIDQAPGLSDEGWDKLVQTLSALAAETAAAGKTMAFHPHSGTYVESPPEVERLLDATAHFDMGICLDTGHDILGGGDPAATAKLAGDRLRHVHLKDVDPRILKWMRAQGGFDQAIEQRVFAPLGSGVLDLAGILTHLVEAEYAGWLMVEQDTAWEPPLEAAAISRRVLDWAQRQLADT